MIFNKLCDQYLIELPIRYQVELPKSVSQ